MFHCPFLPPSASDGPSVSLGNLPDSPAGLYPTTTQDTVRSPVATTAPPVNLLNHHSAYRRPRQGPFSPQHPNEPGDGGGPSSWSGFKPTISALLAGYGTTPPGESSSTATPEQNHRRKRRRSGHEEEETTTITTTITTTTITTTTMQSPGESPVAEAASHVA